MSILNASGLPSEVLRILLGKLEAQMTNISNQEIIAELTEKGKEDAESVQ